MSAAGRTEGLCHNGCPGEFYGHHDGHFTVAGDRAGEENDGSSQLMKPLHRLTIRQTKDVNPLPDGTALSCAMRGKSPLASFSLWLLNRSRHLTNYPSKAGPTLGPA